MSDRLTALWNFALNRKYSQRDILLLAFAFLCLNTITAYIAGLFGYGYPHNSFLFYPADRFADFFKIMDALGVADTWGADQPYVKGVNFLLYALPFDTVYYFSFAKLIGFAGNKYIVYYTWVLVMLASFAWMAKKKGISNGVIFLVAASYPVIYAIDRGNIAMLVFVVLLLALTTKNLWLASFAIAVATSIKIIPFIFIVPIIAMVCLSLKRVAGLLLAFAVFFLAINFISIKIIESQFTSDVFSLSEFNKMTTYFYKEDLLNLRGLAFGSSIYLPTLFVAQKLNYFVEYFTYVRPATLPALILGPIGIYLLIRYDLKSLFRRYFTFEKLVFIVSYSFVLFPPVTGDYYLLILFLPLIVLPHIKYSFWYFIFYGVLLGAKNFIYLDNTNISLQSFINPTLLLIMLVAEFGVLPFVSRDTDTPPVTEYKLYRSNVRKIWVSLSAVIILAVAVMLILNRSQQKEIEMNRKFADAFKNKEWFFSIDGGHTWIDRGEGGLQGFDDNGNPVHADPVWKGEWVNENLIHWISDVGTESWWAAVKELAKLGRSEEYVANAKKFAKKFYQKEWYYSLDGGGTLADRAEAGLKGFDENGSPVHKDPAWIVGEWRNEFTIHWIASNGSESLWLSEPQKVSLTPEEVEKSIRFSKTFKSKKWYYSVDDGKNYSGRAEDGLKGFDEEGRPVHVDPVWGKGFWKDENNIEWVAVNGSKSLWTAHDVEE